MSENALAESLWNTWGADKDLRHAFAWRWLGWNLARQIKAMRQAKGWTQAALAEHSSLTVQTINRYEKSCCHATLRNLRKIACAFDVALVCRFGPFSELLVLMADETVVVPRTFDEDLAVQCAGPPISVDQP